MIHIGLTGWGDHPALYQATATTKDKLFDYSGHFPIVELDTSFYAIPSKRHIEKWIHDTPDNFQFIVKAYQGMTGHLREDNPYDTKEAMFEAFRLCAQAFQDAGKLAMILVQFPPWFDCQTKHVQYIRYVRQKLESFPVAIEFRNQTWYQPSYEQRTLQFLREHQLIHTVCDEPQAGVGSVPFVAEATASKVLVRIHGRNIFGWRNVGNTENWRKVRFLYDYQEEELTEIARHIERLEQQVSEVFILFNNNSGHHAAKMQKSYNVYYIYNLMDLPQNN